MPKLFGSAVDKMFPVFNGMAIWAQDFQVIKSIVSSISIFVMNAKNFWMLIISASLTFCYPSSPYKCSANTIKFLDSEYLSLGNIMASMTTKLCFIISSIYIKFLSALLAYNRYRARIISCFFSAWFRAILCYHIFIAFIRKFLSALSASSCSLFVVLSEISKSITSMGAKFCIFASAFRNIKRFFTMQAYDFFSIINIAIRTIATFYRAISRCTIAIDNFRTASWTYFIHAISITLQYLSVKRKGEVYRATSRPHFI